MDYHSMLETIKESQYLISMTPISRLVELGFTADMNDHTAVLDLCCGYGKMLSLWHEAFGIQGTGVDRCHEFILGGRAMLKQKGITGVTLIEADVLTWHSDTLFDVVCLSGEDFGGLQGTIALLERYVQPGGKLIIGTRYAKTENPPQALIDFEGETLTLMQMHHIIRDAGWYITGMASDDPAAWERYIMWSARRNLEQLRHNPHHQQARDWCETWYETYFTFRRRHEGYVTLLLEKL